MAFLCVASKINAMNQMVVTSLIGLTLTECTIYDRAFSIQSNNIITAV